MKILSLRLAAFRRFSSPVAIEGFDAGLNVLAGPNEFGKSTIFQALEAAFLLRHGTSGAVLDAMRPRSGGEPLVEVDFETPQGLWRIRKQFGRGKAAILTDIKANRAIAFATEAEDRLAALTGVSIDGPGHTAPGRMGLVWVRQQRALLPPDPDMDPVTGKSKARGEAFALIELLGREVEAAAGAGTASRINQRVKAALGELITPGREGAKRGGAYDAALKVRDDARSHLARARQMAEASEQRMARVGELSVSLAALEAPEVRALDQTRLDTLEKSLAAAVVLRSSYDVKAAESKARDLEAAGARDAFQRHLASAARRADLQDAISAVQTLEIEIRELAAKLNGDRATPARLQRLFELERDVAVARSDLSSRSAMVEISPSPGAEGRIAANGTAIRAPARIDVAGRLDIAIEGVGTIGIVTADPAKAAVAKARLEAADAEFSACLAEIGVTSAQEARTRGETRIQDATTLDQARARLSGLAPKGAAALAQELASLTQPGAAGSSDHAQELERTALAHEAAARSARRDYEAAKSAAPDEAAFRALSAELEAARQAASRKTSEARRLAEELGHLKGVQSGIDEDGHAGEVPKALGELELSDREVKRLEAEIAALRLLTTTLSDAETSLRNRYFEPVTRAIAPYLARLFPEAGLDFKDKFSLDALTRAGEKEEFASLSDGTREQLAVLVRMSFAKIIAERGAPMPLILDDPLVYSDDARLAAMCRALEDAAAGHQVILLTCRERAFEKISGHRLAITSWQPG